MENNLIHNLIILEKRISQIASTIEVTFGFDVIKTSHAEDQSDFAKRGLSGSNQNHISNAEMSEFVSFFKRDIAEGIATGEIVNGTQFVIRSLEKELAMAVIAEQASNNYWKLIIKTVFRESPEHRLKVGKGQLVYDK
jgi:hypothetical protein